jgi:hypothetical protein
VIVLDTSAMVEFLVGADSLAERVRAVVVGGKRGMSDGTGSLTWPASPAV